MEIFTGVKSLQTGTENNIDRGCPMGTSFRVAVVNQRNKNQRDARDTQMVTSQTLLFRHWYARRDSTGRDSD